jgi:hypothetical protein
MQPHSLSLVFQMDAYNDAYQYALHAELNNPKGWKIRTVPGYTQLPFYTPQITYSTTEMTAYSFMDDARKADSSGGIDDIFKSKIVHSEDRIALILGQLKKRDRLKYDNLKRIYDDLFRVDQFRSQIDFPQNYMRDRTWSGLNDSEMRLREQVRRELSSAAQDVSFLSNDLRNSLLDFKLQNSKASMLEDTVNSDENNLGGLDETIGPDGSLQTDPGDLHDTQDHQEYDQYRHTA